MKKCSICNTKNDDKEKFCTRCGNNLDEDLDNFYSHRDNDTKAIFRVALVFNIIISVILVYILYHDFGLYVLLIPLFLFSMLGILYAKEKIKNNSFRR